MSKTHYKSVDCHASYQWEYPTRNPFSMPVQRSKNKARLRQQALEAALTAGADYLLVSLTCSQLFILSMLLAISCSVHTKTLDVDCFLVNPKTLQLLMQENK